MNFDPTAILDGAYDPIEPDLTAAATRYVVAHGASDCLAALGLDGGS